MKQSKKERSIVNNFVFGIVLLLLTNGVFISATFLVSRYIRVYPKYFLLGLGLALVIVLLINLTFVIGYYTKKKIFRKIMIAFSCLFILLGGLATFYLYRSSSIIDQMIDLDGVESAQYVLLASNENSELADVYKEKVGYVSFNDDFEATVVGAMKDQNLEVELVHFESLSDLLFDVVSKNINYYVLPKEYKKLGESLGSDVNPFDSAKVLLNINADLDEGSSTVDVSKDPFTILLMGNNESLTDSIILASYNPKMQKVTMTSIPRDSYVPIACQNDRYDKVNHSRAISRKCFIDTIENYVDVNVDFYFETDFYAIVKIVNALGGLEITSPVSFTGTLLLEDSQKYKDIDVPEGTNVLNGEQVLTFARERNNMPRGDYDRQMNQQYVIKQIVSKIISTRNPNKIIEVLDSAKNNIVTNLSMNSIAALMGHALEALSTSPLSSMDAFRIESTQIVGEGDTTRSGMWIMRPYQNDVRNATILINNNLSTEIKLNGSTDFSFTYRNPYVYTQDYDVFNMPSETLWVPNNSASDPSYNEKPNDEEIETPSSEQGNTNSEVPQGVLVIDFSQMSDEEILDWGESNQITINLSFHETSNKVYQDGQFWYQSVGNGTLVEKGSVLEVVRVKMIDISAEDSSSEDTTSQQDN